MAFVNLSLMLGTLLIGLPIVLHLVMREKPKRLVFPAIRFIQQHQKTNRRTLRLRHWLLLLLRCLAIALAAWALARPSVGSSLFGNWLIIAALGLLLLLVGVLFLVGLFTGQSRPILFGLAALGAAVLAGFLTMLIGTLGQSDAAMIGDREAPVAAVMIVDSSPRMQYRQENLTRLEQAQETADWMVRQLPADSRVAIIDSRAITPVFAVDLAAARKTIERAAIAGSPRPMQQLLDTALQLLTQSDLKRKEIYVYTDLAAAAWQMDDPAQLQRKLEQANDVALYVIDVGVEQPQNFALGDLQLLGGDTLPENGKLTVSTTVSCIGNGGKRVVELYVEDVDPSLPLIRDGEVVVPPSRLAGRQEVELPENGSQELQFVVPGLALGTRHAALRIASPDALEVDNARYLTVAVRPPWLILVAAPSDVNTSALVEAIAPYQLRAANRAAFACLVIPIDELTNHSLGDFAAVVLLDPTPLADTAWEQLRSYVEEGGQLAVLLGPNAGDGSSFNEGAATAIMPAKLGRKYRVSGRDVYLAPHNYDHPILRPFRPFASSVPWDQFPIFQYWNLRDLAPETNVVLRYGNNKPALLERAVQQGTVLVMTTPVSELERPQGRQAWNELAGPDDWPRFILMNQIMLYLTQHDAGKYNFDAGQTVVLSNRSDEAPNRYLLFTPQGETQPVLARNEQLTISTTDLPGTYRLKGERDGPVVRGFSVNLPARASSLERMDKESLDQILGPDRYQLAREREQIEREQGRQRAGREFFPFLMSILAVTLILEQLLSNRFYRDTATSTS